MTYEEILQLLKSHTSIRLLKADNAPLIISFLFSAFKEDLSNQEERGIREKELTNLLSDQLYILNEVEKICPKSPTYYLTDWANAGFLRKFSGKTDEFVYELTPVSEQVFKWIDSLEKREFIGTESRLKYLFERMQKLVGKRVSNPSGNESQMRNLTVEEYKTEKQQHNLQIELVR